MSLAVAPVALVADPVGEEDGLKDLRPLVNFLNRFIAYPDDHSVYAHALWIVHAHIVESFDNTPRLAFLSPEPGSGKSRAMEITELLVPRPVLTVNASPAYVFRKVSAEEGLPTLLFDEVDAIFKVKSESNEDLRGLLNSGYRKGAIAGRAVVRGKEVITEDYPSFCAVALAGLNALPDTLMQRSVIIPMKRRKRDFVIESYRRRVNGKEGEQLFSQIAETAIRIKPLVEGSWPELPAGIEDRNADLWEPLIAIADAIGGDWPYIARETALHFVNRSAEKSVTLGVRLLGDLRDVFVDDERLWTETILERLHAIEDAPWASLKGEPIDARYLARTLKQYDLPSTSDIRIDGVVKKGHLRRDFLDAWERYLPPVEKPLQALQPLQGELF